MDQVKEAAANIAAVTGNDVTEVEDQINDLIGKSPISIPGFLAGLPSLLRSYSIKGQQPRVFPKTTKGHITGRVHICMGCQQADGTLERLFKDETPSEQQTKKQRKSKGKPRLGRRMMLYTHRQCRAESMKAADDFVRSQLEDAIRARAEEGSVA